jgi:hypothetical protein
LLLLLLWLLWLLCVSFFRSGSQEWVLMFWHGLYVCLRVMRGIILI